MAEETPGNLGTMFGGWMAGKAAGNRRLDASVDRLEQTINRLSDALEKASGSIGRQARGSGGSGGTQQSQTTSGNGGNPTFMGHRGDPTGFGGHLASMWGGGPGPSQATGGLHRDEGPANGGAVTFGGQMLRGAYDRVGGARGIALGGAAIAAGAGAIYTHNHYASQQMGQSLAAQYAGGPNWNAAYQAGIPGNYSAVNAADNFQAANMLAGQGGYVMGSAGYQQARAQVNSISMINPQISNAQAQGAALGLAQVGTYNRMQALGMNPMGQGAAGNTGDPRSLARQILQRIGGIDRVKTPDQVAAMFAPAGSATVTVNGMVSAGYIPAASAPAVLSEMRNIMQARIHGMSYNQYNKFASIATASSPTSSAGKDARSALQSAGLANTMVNQQRGLEGQQRDTEAKTITGFADGVTAATKTLSHFRDALNAILGLPGVGFLAGFGSGATGTMPLLGGLLGKIPGGGMLKGAISAVGGTAPTMSQGGGGDMGGWGGDVPGRQSAGAHSGGAFGRSNASGSSGISLQAPRPGLDSMSSEQDFGPRNIGQGFHTGIDLQGRVGDPVKAAGAGVIVAAGWGASGDGGYGNVILIDHGGGWKTMYAHLSSITKGKGRRVRAGEVIGRVGQTGSYARGPHLHFELWKHGKPVDPAPYLRGKKINAPGAAAGAGSEAKGSAPGGSLAATSLGGTGTTMGSATSYANAVGSSGGGGGGGMFGGYSEVAALGIGSGSSLGGAMGAGDESGSQQAGSPGGPSSMPGGAFGPGGAGSAKIATFNTHTSNVSAAADERDLAKIMSSGVGAMSLQEFYYKHKAGPVVGWLEKQGWGVYKGPTGTSITWDKSKYNGSNFGTEDLNTKYRMPKGISQRYATYGLLTDKSSGAKFWQVSVHMIPNAGRAHVSQATRDAMWREQQTRLNALQQRLGRSAPVVVGGDFNANSNNILSGMSSDHISGIDSIFGTKGVTSQSGATKIGGLASDHDATVSNLMFSGAAGSGGGNGSSGGGGVHGLHGNKAIVNQIAAKYGWGRGKEWNALVNLINSESGFRNTAQNPHSTAYGMFQFLDNTWKGYPYGKTSDPRKQAVDGLSYVKGRYGDPIKAWSFHQRNNWYEMGEWNIRDDKDARVHKGEMIFPSKIADIIRTELTAPGINSARGHGGATINFHPNSITVVMGGNSSKKEAQQAGTWVMDAIMEDQRMKDLADGVTRGSG